ncbi:hypothetical protein J6590_022637 [Homalodisca vitripennis]|nr:hypothetical protein J6590_022637 [Homalodisca vitripennis]
MWKYSFSMIVELRCDVTASPCHHVDPRPETPPHSVPRRCPRLGVNSVSHTEPARRTWRFNVRVKLGEYSQTWSISLPVVHPENNECEVAINNAQEREGAVGLGSAQSRLKARTWSGGLPPTLYCREESCESPGNLIQPRNPVVHPEPRTLLTDVKDQHTPTVVPSSCAFWGYQPLRLNTTMEAQKRFREDECTNGQSTTRSGQCRTAEKAHPRVHHPDKAYFLQQTRNVLPRTFCEKRGIGTDIGETELEKLVFDMSFQQVSNIAKRNTVGLSSLHYLVFITFGG